MCATVYPFSNPKTVKCDCSGNKLFQNNKLDDCSELAPSLVVTSNSGSSVVMVIFAVAGTIYSLLMGLMLVARSDSPMIKAMSPFFCFVILSGCVLSYLSVLVFIGEPSAFTCAARPWFLTTAFGLCFSMIAAKNWRIYSIFGNIKRMQENLTNLRMFIVFAGIVLGFEWLMSAIWTGASVLRPYNSLSNNGAEVAATCASAD